jgi:tetratricopeptide (TPR) repeat protein
MEPQSKQYTCKNPGECEKSDKGEIIEIAPGDDLICPGCKRNTLEPYEAKKKFPFWVYPVVIALALALCGGIYFGYLKYIAPSEVSKKPVTETPGKDLEPPKPPEPQKSPKVLVEEGIAFVKQSKYEDAERAFRKAVDLDPGNADALGNLGAVYSVMGKKDDAFKYTSTANEKNPRNPNWWMNLAEIYCTRGDRDNAIKALENAVKNGFKDMNALKDMNLQLIENDPSYTRIVGSM